MIVYDYVFMFDFTMHLFHLAKYIVLHNHEKRWQLFNTVVHELSWRDQ